MNKSAVAPTSEAQQAEWSEWRDRIWNQLAAEFGYPGLCALEQYMIRSAKEKRCVECGDAGTARCDSHLIKSVRNYWMCSECHTYWENKR